MSENNTATSTPAATNTGVEATSNAADTSTASSEISASDLEALSGAPAAAEVKEAQEKLDNAQTESERKAAQKEVENAKRKYQLKVDGKVMDWEGTDEDIVRELQLSKKARKEIQESATLKKELALFVEALKNDPASVLADPAIGVDIKRFAEQILAQTLEEEAKSPEQREREQLEKEVEQLRKEIKEREERQRNEEYERMVSQHESDLEEKVEEALNTSGLPKSPYVLKRMADVMLSVMNKGKDITPKKALEIVRKEMNKDIKDMFAATPEEVLEELIGSDNIKRLNKRQLAKLKQAKIASVNQVKDSGHVPDDSKQKQVTKKKTISEWLNG